MRSIYWNARKKKEVVEEVAPIVEAVEQQVNTPKKKTLKDAKQSA